jgi:hypothetical protein
MTGFDDDQVSEQIQSIDVVETTDEDGQVHYFEPVEEFDIDDQLYALLIYQGKTLEPDEDEPEDEDEDGYEEEFVVMRVIMDDDGRLYESIEDEEEFEKVVKALENLDFEVDLFEHLGLNENHDN